MNPKSSSPHFGEPSRRSRGGSRADDRDVHELARQLAYELDTARRERDRRATRSRLNVQTSIRIARPIHEVLAYASDLRNLGSWNKVAQSVQKAPSRRAAVARCTVVREGIPATNGSALVSEPRRSFAIYAAGESMLIALRYCATPEGRSTLVKVDAGIEVELPGLSPLETTFERRYVRKRVREDLGTLRLLLE